MNPLLCIVLSFLAGLATMPAAAQATHDDAASLTAHEIVKQAVANLNKREALPQNYTYIEKFTNYNAKFPKLGPDSDLFEVIEIKGRAFRRYVAHNDRQLADSAAEHDEAYMAKLQEAERKIFAEEIKQDHTAQSLAAAVQKILDDAGMKDWKPELAINTSQSMGVVTFSQSLKQFKLPLGELDQRFKLKAPKEEFLNGRKTYVIQADPLHGKQEDTARNFKIKVWIDQKELQIVKAEGKALRQGLLCRADYAEFSSKALSTKEITAQKQLLAKTELFYGADTVVTQEWDKLNDEVWLPQRRHVKGWHVFVFDHPYTAAAPISSDPVEYETLDANYRKFRVQHRILPAVAAQ